MERGNRVRKWVLKQGKAGRRVNREVFLSSLSSYSCSWLRVTSLPHFDCSRCLLTGRMLTT